MDNLTRKKQLYWSLQLMGWSCFVVLALLFNFMVNGALSGKEYFNAVVIFFLGLFFSEMHHFFIKTLNWSEQKILPFILKLIISSVLIGLVFNLLFFLIQSFLFQSQSDVNSWILQSTAWITIFTLWSAFYFSYHFFTHYQTEKFKALEIMSKQNEMELYLLKKQLRPHFLFNAMNSIKALISIDPEKAKTAVTKLSIILRKSITSERKKETSIGKEMELVEAYLDMEKIRFENRLNWQFSIDNTLLNIKIPPFCIQGLVENAIKHGMEKSIKGIDIQLIIKNSDNRVFIEVINSGLLYKEKPPGTGLNNLRQQISILYGNKAHFKLTENRKKHTVSAKIEIPYHHA